MARIAIREKMNDIGEAPGKTWFWDLEAAVIEADRCIQCGSCIAVCPSDSLWLNKKGLPTLVKMCTGCSLCWDFCPRGGLRYETTFLDSESSPLEDLVSINQSRAKNDKEEGHFQDGGAVSIIAASLLEKKLVDGVILAKEDPDNPHRGLAHIATTKEEILKCSGSFYNQTMSLAHIKLSEFSIQPDAQLALIGTPCEIQAVRAMQKYPWKRGSQNVDAIQFTIALLCTKNFDYESLYLHELRDKRSIDLAQIKKIDIMHGKLIVTGKTGDLLLSEPIKNFHSAALRGCDECSDFVGAAADISIGSVGSEDGYSSVLVRTPNGAKAFDCAKEYLDILDLPKPEAILKLNALDSKVASSHLARPVGRELSPFISYRDHASYYDGTNRAPVLSWIDK